MWARRAQSRAGMQTDAHHFDDTWLIRGRELAARGEHEQAIACFDRGGASVAAISAKADSLFALGRARESLVTFEAALHLKGDAAYPWYGIGRALTRMGSHAEAIAPLRTFLALSPITSVLTKQVSAWLDAMTRLEDIPSVPPPSDPVDRACALRVAGKPRDALQVLESEAASPRATVWIERARCHELLERADLAEEAVIEAIMRDQEDPDAWVLRARVCVALNKRVDARRAVEMIVRLRPRVSSYLVAASSVCASIGDHHAAIKHALDALMLDPANVDGWLIKGKSDLALGQTQAAIAAFRRVRHLARPDDFRMQHEANVALTTLGAR
jgi:tetratricopeptide (TPR) repeat protein